MGAPLTAKATFSIRPGAPLSCASAAKTFSASSPRPIARPAATNALEAWKAPASGNSTWIGFAAIADRQSLGLAFALAGEKLDGLAGFAHGDQGEPALLRRGDEGVGMFGIAIDHAHAVFRHHFGEKPELGREVILEGAVIIQVIAGDDW